MDDALKVASAFAVICLFVGIVLICSIVRWYIRAEVRRAIKALKDSKFVLQRRDPKSGRWTR